MSNEDRANEEVDLLARMATAIAEANGPTRPRTTLLAVAVTRLMGAAIKLTVVGGARDASVLHTTLDMLWDRLKVKSGNAPGGVS